MFTNRRKYQRIASHKEECSVIVDNRELRGFLVDESINGAGVAGVDFLMIPNGQPLQVRHRDTEFFGNVRFVSRDENGCVQVGVSRSEELIPLSVDENAMLLNCYIQHQNQLIVCIPIAMKNDRIVRVQLFDGMQFDTLRDSLLSFTRTERFKQLGDQGRLDFTCGLYGLGEDSKDAKVRRQEVFEFEFGVMKQCPTDTLLSI
jgi:hypothetical protein